MRKLKKTFLIISGIFSIFGIIFIIAGISMGGANAVAGDVLDGRLSFSFDRDFFSNEEMENMNRISNSENLFSKEEVNSISIDGKYGEYEINAWDKDEYSVQGIKGTDKVKYSIDNGNLKISVEGKYVITGNDVEVEIYIPDDIVLDSMELNMGAGTMECNDIRIQHLDVNIGAGEGIFNNVEATSTKFKVGAGEGETRNAKFTDCDLKVGMGNIDIEGSVAGNLNVDCGLGNTELELANSYSDFNYTVKVGAGNVEIGKEQYSGMGNNINLDNDADSMMNIKCGMGNVSVDFMEMQ